jgi:hypothetical protein
VDKQRMQLLKVSMLMDHRHLSRARELMDSLQVAEIAPANRSLVTRLRTRLQGMTEAEASEREAQRQSQSDAEAPPRRPAQATTPAQSAE